MSSKFVIVNATGCTVNLLQSDDAPASPTDDAKSGKWFQCRHPNCGRAFSTSGHLKRHHRIHTGEKNYKCLLAQCPSRFSRQDNMMQHFRTHFLKKPRKIYVDATYFSRPTLPSHLPPYPRIMY